MSAANKLFVGNLSWNTTSELLKEAFAQFGNVVDVCASFISSLANPPTDHFSPPQAVHMSDRETGRYRGFGFVTLSSDAEAQAAIAGLNEQELHGRRIRVNVAQAKSERSNSGGYGGNNGGGFESGGW
ncbi:Heterogeneous nuclear ribonucleoprotein [Mycena chlorophos]|uniref:Heterogeneous nuclear ribonucleoprotein n=1 Tax=Mycena chlorophos TaxID=658473 RepID=A0A8H6W3T3_MYCCL|nr:Heterogeneous nuclear ribonucleoprotein [Mycena chlorophos]